ncbi:MAG: 50S ribosomal protein L28 [Pseudoramibacter sp.]
MAKECFVCHKGVVSGNTVAHSNKHNKRMWKPNLQKIKIVVDGTPRREYVCTRCLRSGKVERA